MNFRITKPIEYKIARTFKFFGDAFHHCAHVWMDNAVEAIDTKTSVVTPSQQPTVNSPEEAKEAAKKSNNSPKEKTNKPENLDFLAEAKKTIGEKVGLDNTKRKKLKAFMIDTLGIRSFDEATSEHAQQLLDFVENLVN